MPSVRPGAHLSTSVEERKVFNTPAHGLMSYYLWQWRLIQCGGFPGHWMPSVMPGAHLSTSVEERKVFNTPAHGLTSYYLWQ